MLPTHTKKTRFRSTAPTLTRGRLALGLAVLVATIGVSFFVPRSATAQERRSPDDNPQVLLRGTPRAKTIANIPAAFVAAVKREYESSAELQRETKFEPYLANRYFWAIENLELTEGRTRIPTKRPLTMCTDGLCDAPLNTNVWTGAWTGGVGTNISNPNLPIAAWTPGIVPNNNSIPDTSCGPHSSQAHHSIVPNGNDPVIPSIKTVAPVPASGNTASLRLGNRCPLYGGERVSKTFTVLAGQTTLQFWYATVLQDPGHPASAQPGFGTYLLNGSTLVPNRVDIDPATPGKQEFIVADRNNPFFGYNQSLGVVYRDWTCVTIDLAGLEGQTLTLLLVNRDCTASGHWGYSYVDSFCLGCAGNPTGDASFNPAKSDCATGKICFDYTVPKSTNGTNGKVNLTLELYQNGVLVNTLTSGDLTTSGTYCFTNVLSSVNAAVGGFDWKATANFTLTGATISPVEIGKREEGTVSGKNNDCLTPVKPIDPCCPPWNPDMLKDMLFYQGSGSISAPYTLKFQPTAAFNNQMQAYINYLHSVNPAITAITIDWRLHDQSQFGSPPYTTYGPQIGSTTWAQWTWNNSGIGNPTLIPNPFFTLPNYPMSVNTWYMVHTGIYLENGQRFFPDSCSNNEINVRFNVTGNKSVGPNSRSGPVLEFSDGKKVIKSVPLSESKQQR